MYCPYDFDGVNNSGKFHHLALAHFKFLKGAFMQFSPSKMPTFVNENHHVHKIPHQITKNIHGIFYKAILKSWDPYQNIRKIIFQK